MLEIKLSMEKPQMCDAEINTPIYKEGCETGPATDGNPSEAALKLKTSLIEAERLLQAIKMDFRNLQILANDECASA